MPRPSDGQIEYVCPNHGIVYKIYAGKEGESVVIVPRKAPRVA